MAGQARPDGPPVTPDLAGTLALRLAAAADDRVAVRRILTDARAEMGWALDVVLPEIVVVLVADVLTWERARPASPVLPNN